MDLISGSYQLIPVQYIRLNSKGSDTKGAYLLSNLLACLLSSAEYYHIGACSSKAFGHSTAEYTCSTCYNCVS